MIGLETIEKLLRWGKAREVSTKRGPRMVRSAMATEDFWTAWNANEQELRAAGISVGRDYEDPNKWRVSHWQEVDAAILAEREKRVDMSGATSAEIVLPKPDGLDYMPFQKAGVRYCLNVFKTQDAGVLIGDAPGLGKTIQAIGLVNATPEISRILIICPMTLKSNWERELTRWLVRPLTIGHATSEFWPRTDIVISHYNILHKFPTRLTTYWDLLVVDECHRAKNAKARQTRCIVGHKPSRKEAAQGVQPTSGIPAKRKLMLSGTPFENRPAELWPIVSYIAPGLFSSRSAFEKRYCGGMMGSHGWEAVGATNLPELGERLRGTCFPEGTLIDSAHGKTRIEDIYRSLPMSVWSADKLGRISLKPVVAVHREESDGILVEVRHADGVFRCTPDHRVFAREKGYVRADCLTGNDCLLCLRKENGKGTVNDSGLLQAGCGACLLESVRGIDASKGEEGSASNGEGKDAGFDRQGNCQNHDHEIMRALWRTVHRPEQEGIQSQALLLIQLPWEASIPSSREQDACGSKEAGGVASEKGKDQEPARSAVERHISQTSHTSLPKRSLSEKAARAQGFDASNECPSRAWGLPNSERGENHICGHYIPGIETDCGSGRPYSCNAQTAQGRQGEGCFAGWSRVQSVEVLELGNRGLDGNCCAKDSFVYDIEVAGNHNYFAEGCLVHNCMVRRTKEEVLKELPPKTRVVIELSAEGLGEAVRREQGEWAKYGGELEAAHVKIELAKASDDEAAFKAVVADLRKKMGVAFTELARVRHETALAKLPAMVELLREEIEELGSVKVVIFAHHTDVLKMAHAAFPGSVLITGDTPADERDKIVQRFQTDRNCGPFFGSIRATGEGITLTASSTVVFFESDWTASKMAQCSDRCHRIGQKDNVLVKYYILPGTIDAHMIQTWIKKEVILEQALDTERDELAAEPSLVPKAEPLATRHQLTVAATAITAAQRAAILDALRYLSEMCDGARAIDGMGFCKFDVAIGKSLALCSALSPMQAALGHKLLVKYRRQLGDEILERCGIKTKP